MTRCFLNDSPSINKTLWAELVKTACSIKNQLPSSSNESFMSPFEKIYKVQAAINHLQIIGSKFYAKKTGRIQGKQDERSTECSLVGYELENIYKVFDPYINRALKGRDFVICEDSELNLGPSQEVGE